jgi:hypothetical protein
VTPRLCAHCSVNVLTGRGSKAGDIATKAKQCFEDAAAAGDVSAAYWLGVATLNGDGVVGIRCDPKRGLALITQAAGGFILPSMVTHPSLTVGACGDYDRQWSWQRTALPPSIAPEE